MPDQNVSTLDTKTALAADDNLILQQADNAVKRITGADLKADVAPPSASETEEGTVERLTDTEAADATDTTRYMSSVQIKTLIDRLIGSGQRVKFEDAGVSYNDLVATGIYVMGVGSDLGSPFDAGLTSNTVPLLYVNNFTHGRGGYRIIHLIRETGGFENRYAGVFNLSGSIRARFDYTQVSSFTRDDRGKLRVIMTGTSEPFGSAGRIVSVNVSVGNSETPADSANHTNFALTGTVSGSDTVWSSALRTTDIPGLSGDGPFTIQINFVLDTGQPSPNDVANSYGGDSYHVIQYATDDGFSYYRQQQAASAITSVSAEWEEVSTEQVFVRRVKVLPESAEDGQEVYLTASYNANDVDITPQDFTGTFITDATALGVRGYWRQTPYGGRLGNISGDWDELIFLSNTTLGVRYPYSGTISRISVNDVEYALTAGDTNTTLLGDDREIKVNMFTITGGLPVNGPWNDIQFNINGVWVPIVVKSKGLYQWEHGSWQKADYNSDPVSETDAIRILARETLPTDPAPQSVTFAADGTDPSIFVSEAHDADGNDVFESVTRIAVESDSAVTAEYGRYRVWQEELAAIEDPVALLRIGTEIREKPTPTGISP